MLTRLRCTALVSVLAVLGPLLLLGLQRFFQHAVAEQRLPAGTSSAIVLFLCLIGGAGGLATKVFLIAAAGHDKAGTGTVPNGDKQDAGSKLIEAMEGFYLELRRTYKRVRNAELVSQGYHLALPLPSIRSDRTARVINLLVIVPPMFALPAHQSNRASKGGSRMARRRSRKVVLCELPP